MKKNNYLIISILTLIITLSLVLTACSSSQQAINIIGSTSVQPIAQELADAYSSKKGTKINIQGVGSSAGIQAAKDGTCDIGTSSRDLKSEEKTAGLVETVIAIDGIGVVVHPNNKVSSFKKDDIAKIFSGEIKNWKDLGGEDNEIIVVSREEGSGTRDAFEEMTKLSEKKGDKTVSKLKSDAIICDGNGAVKSTVAGKENSIGYLSVGYIDNSVKACKIDDVEPTVENIKARKYPIQRPFLFLTKGEPKGAAKDFIDFVKSDEGQKIVSKSYISVK